MDKRLLAGVMLVVLLSSSSGLKASGVVIHKEERPLRDTQVVLEGLLQEAPQDVEILCALAEVHFYLGDWVDSKEQIPLWEEGVAYAQKAVELEPECAPAHYWVAVLWGKIGRARGVLQSLFLVNTIFEHLDRALSLDPDYSWAHFALSHIYQELPPKPLGKGDRQQALFCAQRAWELERTEPEFSVHYAKLLVRQRQFDQARGVLEEALTTSQDWTDPMRSQAEEILASLYTR